ncbi:MAG: zinc ABC transporter substrate-binding protein [Desulfobacteraceae bacterium]
MIEKKTLPALALGLVMMMLVTGTARAEEKTSLFVSIAPQAYLAKQIGREKVAVNVLVPPGKSPATYAPNPGQMVKLARASLFFSINVPFERALMPKLARFANGLAIVDTTKGINTRKFASGGADPHTWMSPLLAAKMAQTMCAALCDNTPDLTSFFKANLAALLADLNELHQRLKKELAPLKGKTILVFHPVFGYFTDLYGLEQKAVEKGGRAPRGKELAGLIKQAKKENIRVVFVQPQFDTRTAGKIAEAIDGAVVPMDPLAEDYIANLEKMALTLKKQLNNQ